jgi:hypothetical protein
MRNCLRHPIRGQLFSKTLLAWNVLLGLVWLPCVLRIYTIPALLKRLSGRTRFKTKTAMTLEDAISVITLVCRLKAFRLPIFPKLCLRQSLLLYRALARMGYPVEIHFGVLKDEEKLHGHSWVTLQGKPVADTAHSGSFKAVYSHSAINGG